MRFGPVPLSEAEGALLGHSLHLGDRRLPKGHCLSRADLQAAARAGLSSIVVAHLESTDIAENVVAAMVSEALSGSDVRAERPIHGRVNLLAERAGLLQFDADRVFAVNMVDEAITLAVLPPMSPVRTGAILATVKVIPYAVAGPIVEIAAARAAECPVSVAPFQSVAVDLIQTRLAGQNPSLFTKTARVTRSRIERLGARLVSECTCVHEERSLAELLRRANDTSITLIAAASATVDRRDVVPSAIVAAGGQIERLGMPVDPGNLLCFGRIGARRIIGLPGCGRSPKRNGLDLVLERLIADMPVDSPTIAAMGVGGLLADVAERGQPRSQIASGPSSQHEYQTR